MNFPHIYESIFTKEKIHYGAFKIKHQKALIQMMDEINDDELEVPENSFHPQELCFYYWVDRY